MARALFPSAQTDALQAVGDVQQEPQQAHREHRRQQIEIKGEAQHDKNEPEDGTGGIHHTKGLVGRLADLLPQAPVPCLSVSEPTLDDRKYVLHFSANG